MKNLKKVMALVIVLSMVVSMFTVMTASAADFEDVIGTVYEEAVMTLAPMGVIAGYEEDGKILFKPEQIVTRAEMAAFIIRQLGLSAAAKADTDFTDVPKEFWGSGAIKIANTKNIIVGYGDGTFGPDDQVSFEAAVKMIVCALGFEEDAKDNGGWPVGYLTVADQLNLLDGLEEKMLDTTAGCDRGTVALLLYNALDINIQEVTYYNGEVLSKTLTNSTMASEMGYYKFADAVVNATDKAVVSGKLQDTGYAAIQYNGYTYEMVANGNNLDQYLGQKVTLYASYNKKLDEYTIVAVTGTSVKSDVVTLDAADIYGMDGTKLEYYIDKETSSKTSDYQLAALQMDEGDLEIVYNNKSIAPEDQDYAIITGATNGTITLIDSAKDGVYERVILETYKNYQVVEVDVEENKLYLEDNNDTTEVELDNSREINRPKFSIVDTEGAELALADLAEDDVLSIYSDVYKSGDDYVADADSLKIVVCNDTIEGAVTQKSAKKIYIDGEAYETDGVLPMSDFDLDDEGVFFMDFNGDIAFADTAAVLDNFQFVYDGIVDGREITLYTMDANGEKVEYDMATTVRVNGESFNMGVAERRNALASVLKIDGSNGLTDEYIVSLKTNDNNKITRITILDGELEEDGYLTHADKLIGNYTVSADTVIFTLPQGADFDEDDLKAVKYNNLKNNTSYDFKVCDVDKNNVVTCMIVYTTTGKVDFASNIAVIQSVSTTKVDDEVVLSLTMIQEGKVVTKNTDSDDIFFISDAFKAMYGESAKIAYGAYPGQIIMYSETAGAISNVDRVYPRPCLAADYEEGYYLVDEFQTWDNTFNRNDKVNLFLGAGFVTDKNNKTNVITVDSAVEEEDASFVASYGAARVVVVDTNMTTEESAVKVGSTSDIKVGDYVVVRKYQGTVRDIVVYKNFVAAPAFFE